MSTYEDSRWEQRLQNYQRALTHLDQAIKISETPDFIEYGDLEKQGVIKCFEMTFDLSWKTMQDYLDEQGYKEKGPKNTIQQAFKDGLIKDGDAWMKILDGRNLASHTYDGDMADELIKKILGDYYLHFDDLDRVLTKIKNG